MIDFQFLCSLLNSCGVSSNEMGPSSLVRQYLNSIADRITCDVMGNTVAVINEEGRYNVMVAAHIDEIGLQIIGFEDNGLLRLRKIGGVNTLNIIGQEISVCTSHGFLPGVIVAKLTGQNNEIPDISNCFADIFCKDRETASKLVEIGDYITFSPNARIVSDTVISKSIDDRCGVFIISQVMVRLKGKLRNVRLTVATTTQEEIGLRGMATVATNETPAICLNVDVTDACQIGKKDLPKIGDGSVLYRNADSNPKLLNALKSVADTKQIPLSFGVSRNITGGTDASRMQLFSKGTAVADVSVPCKYMHTHNEVCSVTDIEACIKLLEAFVLYLDNFLESDSPDYTF